MAEVAAGTGTTVRPGVSIVICTHNRGGMLRKTLASLAGLVGGVAHEIIVVDNNSSDDTAGSVGEFARSSGGRVRYLFEGRQGLSVARNAGIGAARGEIVAFLDDDVTVVSGWLDALWKVYQDEPGAGGVGGRIIPVLPPGAPSWLAQLSTTAILGFDYSPSTTHMPFPHAAVGCNMSFRRSVFELLGGFRTDLGRMGALSLAGEDTEMCWRVQKSGRNIYYSPDATVYHYMSPERLRRSRFRREAYGHGRSRAMLEPWRDGWKTPVGSAVRALWGISWNLAGAVLEGLAGKPAACLAHDLMVYRRAGYLHGWLRRILKAKDPSSPALVPADPIRVEEMLRKS